MMTDYAAYLENDFELRDDLQEVSLTNAVTTTMVDGVKARFRNLNHREAMLGGSLALEPSDQVLMIGSKRLSDAVPNRGDTVKLADDTTWTIISDVLNRFGSTPVFYEVIVRKQLDLG